MAALLLALLAVLPARPAFAQADAGDANAARAYYYEDVFNPFFALDSLFGRYRAQRKGSIAASFAAVKPAGTFRVFVVGGSIANSYDDGRVTLKDALEEALPGRAIEVVNCGMGGYDSPREELIVDEVLAYSPDAILLMTGHNESLRYPWIPRWRLRLNGVVTRLLRAAARPPRRTPAADKAAVQARLGEFEAAVRRMARASAAKKVPFVLLAPPLNLRDGPAATHLPLDPAFRRGWGRFLLGDCPGARAEWAREANGEPSSPSLAAFFTGRCLEKEGRPRDADAAYVRALALDAPLEGRCGTDCRSILEKVAREEGALLADGDKEMRALAAPGLPGLELFNDRVHWRPEANPAVSAAVVEALRRGPSLAALPWRGAPKPAPVPPRPASEEGWTKVLRYAVEAMNEEPDKLTAMTWIPLEVVSERWPRGLADPEAQLDRLERILNKRGAAWGMATHRARRDAFYWHLATVRLAAGDARGAQQDFLTATRDGASSPWFWADRAAERRRAGSRAGAEALLARAAGNADAEAAARAAFAPRR